MRYSELVEVYERLEKVSGKIEKTKIVAELIENTEEELLPAICMLLQGRVFPPWEEVEIGIAEKLMEKIIAKACGFSEDEVSRLFRETGDLGKVAEALTKKKKQRTLFSKPLTVELVFKNLRKAGIVEGKGAQERKAMLVAELLGSAGAKEAAYIVRTVLGELRIGVAEGIVRDAISLAFFVKFVSDPKRMREIAEQEKKRRILAERGLEIDGYENVRFVEKESLRKIEVWKEKSKVDYVFTLDKELADERNGEVVNSIEWAWFLRSDYGEIAVVAKREGLEGLKKVKIKLGNPIHVLLAEKANSLEEAIESFENVAIEVKYDGMRAQIHKRGKEVWIFTRRLENVTRQFPELVEMVRKNVKANECLIEGEVIGIDREKKRPLPFQVLSQRIHRKYEIEEMARKIPVEINIFDIVYLDGEQLFDRPFKERRKILESIIQEEKGRFQLAEEIVGKDMERAKRFYENALKNGQEGVMVKNMDATYQPGRRVAGGWLKVKPIMETLDLVITGATWGTGKRAGWLGSFVLSCKEEDTGRFLECGMMGTGVKEKKTSPEDVTFQDLTNMVKEDILSEKGNEVSIRPKLVIEVAFEEIQKSPNYSSGFALRFPRLVRVRWDKGPEEADTLERIKMLYERQRGRKAGS